MEFNNAAVELDVLVTNSSVPFERARTASIEELGRLLETFRPYLLAIANAELPRSLAGKLGPSDLVQITLIKGHAKFADFRGESLQELAHWLRSILSSRLKNVVRDSRRKRRNVIRERPVSNNLAHPRQASPCDQIIHFEERERVVQAMKKLPELYRRAIELRQFGNLTFQEVGQKLGRSEDATGKLWARAVRRLQKELGIHADQ